MEARDTDFLQLLDGRKQFSVPIFQRRYSWEKKHCKKLWDDVLRLGQNSENPSHFLGSIVYIEPRISNVSGVRELHVIDGQQRLTTLTLLLVALSRAIEEQGSDIGITPEELSDYYLNVRRTDKSRYKQLLTQHDEDTLIQLLDDRIEFNEPPADASPRLLENYCFFETELKSANLETVYSGIQKLRIVDIALDRSHDNPQLIFESLNSTGLELSQADLIRNYVLMGQELEFQNKLYNHHWLPMERRFGDAYTEWFDWFVRDYLTVKRRQIPNIGKVYETFKMHVPGHTTLEALETTIAEIGRYSKHYVKFVLLQESDSELLECLRDIDELDAGVARPLLLEVYEDYMQGQLQKSELIEILRLVESYVFRRAICGIPTNTLNRVFESLMAKVKKNNYLKSLKAAFRQLSSTRRYPSNSEFKEALFIKDVYNFSRCNYQLRKLENHGRREPISIADYTIEHVMPQNPYLSEAWQQELGENWREVQEKYLHTIGNLTLTGYNSKLSDRPFKEKQCIVGGFRDSPLRLNGSLAQTKRWDKYTILTRAEELADKALKIWVSPE